MKWSLSRQPDAYQPGLHHGRPNQLLSGGIPSYAVCKSFRIIGALMFPKRPHGNQHLSLGSQPGMDLITGLLQAAVVVTADLIVCPACTLPASMSQVLQQPMTGFAEPLTAHFLPIAGKLANTQLTKLDQLTRPPKTVRVLDVSGKGTCPNRANTRNLQKLGNLPKLFCGLFHALLLAIFALS